MNTFNLCITKPKTNGTLSSYEIPALRDKAANTPITIDSNNYKDFIELIGKNGYAFCPSTFTNNTYNKNTFQQTSILALYFDTTSGSSKKRFSYDDILNRAKKYDLPVWFAYDSFSFEFAESRIHRFCVIFLLNNPIHELREAETVQKALMMIFPEADSSCSVLKLYTGGNEVLYYNKDQPELDIEWLFMKMCLYLRDRYGSTNYKRKIVEFSKYTGILLNKKGYPIISLIESPKYCENDSNTLHSNFNKKLPKSIYNIGFGKNLLNQKHHICFTNEVTDLDIVDNTVKRTSYRSSELKLLNNSCQLFQAFTSGDRKLSQKELLGIASNLTHIEGGTNMFLATLKSKNYPRIEYDSWHFQLGYLRTSNPKPCRSFCPYQDCCPHGKTILSTLKPKYHQIERIENLDDGLVTLDEAYQHLVEQFMEAVDSNKKGWHVIFAQTAIGKTAIILYLLSQTTLKILIAVPTNLLKREVCERAKELGIDLVASPSLHELKDQIPDDVWDDIKALYTAGKPVMSHIDKAILENDKSCSDVFLQYKKDLAKFHSSSCGVTTHRRLTKMDIRKYDLVIVDEDIVYSTIIPNRLDVSVSDLKKLRKKLDSKSPLGSKIRKILDHGDEHEVFSLGIVEYEDIYDDIGVDINLPALCAAEHFCYRHGSDRDDGANEDCITFAVPVHFPKNVKYIMLSATANKEICEYSFDKENVTFYDTKKAFIAGMLNQYYDRSMSRSVMRKDPKIIESIKAWTGVENTISFKEFIDQYPGDLYFGNCIGSDTLKGKNIDVIGTPHQPEWVYKLFSSTLGYHIDEKLKPNITVVYNGYRFRFTSYTSAVLRQIQFYMIESELEQAVGRARLLRCNCTVNLFSDFPLRQAILMESGY